MASIDYLDDVLFEDTWVEIGPAMEALRKAAERANMLSETIKDLEAILKEQNDAHRQLVTQEIPGLMAELGELSEVKGPWGTVKLSPFWSGKITEETEQKAFEWLEENGHGGIIKRDILVSVPKGDDTYADKVRHALDMASARWEEKQGVHYQTLQGFIRAMAKAGTPVPTDLFNVYTGTVAKVDVMKG